MAELSVLLFSAVCHTEVHFKSQVEGEGLGEEHTKQNNVVLVLLLLFHYTTQQIFRQLLV